MTEPESQPLPQQSVVRSGAEPAAPATVPQASMQRAATVPRVAALSTRLGVSVARSGPMLMYQLNRLGRTGLAGATLLLFAVIFVVSAVLPRQREIIGLTQQIQQAHRLTSTAETAPVRLNRFMNTLPRRSELPDILGKVFVLASAAGVTLEHGRYELSPTRAGHLAQYRMTFPVKAQYPQIRQFIDSVLTTVPNAALEGLRIERKGVGEDSVNADLRFSVFVRNDS